MCKEELQRIVKSINEKEEWASGWYYRNEVVKMLTEPVAHITLVHLKTADEIDLVYDRTEWVVSMDRASLNTIDDFIKLRSCLAEKGIYQYLEEIIAENERLKEMLKEEEEYE